MELGVDRSLRALRSRADLVGLSVLLLVLFASGRVPGGIVGVGVVAGAALALQAAGVVLIYRSDRIVNFAQVQIGVVAAVLFRLLVEHRTLPRALGSVCGPCDRPGGTIDALTYWIAAIASIGAALAIAWLIHVVVVRRFRDAPRLVLTIATIGIAQVLGSAQEALPRLFATARERELEQIARGIAAPPPLDWSFGWAPAIFRASDILTVVLAAAAIGGIVAYLRRGRGGIRSRAAAENPARAATLGIDVDHVTGRVWLMAGGLSGLAGVLAAMSTPSPAAGALSIDGMVRILAVAVVAGMTSLPVVASAAVAIGILDQGMLWIFGSGTIVDVALTGLIGAVLLLQRARTSRAEQELVGAWQAAREIRPIPAELRGVRRVRTWIRRAIGALVVIVIGAPFILTPTQTDQSTIVLVYAMVGVSLVVLSGWAGQISLGQFAIAAVGATVAVLAGSVGIPALLVLGLSAIAGGIVALVLGLPALRVRGLHLAIMTLAFAGAVAALLDPQVLGERLPDGLGRPILLGIDLDDARSFFFFAVLVLAAIVAAAAGLRRSRIGRALIAARDNEPAAQAFGISLARARLTAFAASGAMAALAGGVFAYHQNGVHVASYRAEVSIGMFLMAVIGGLGSIAGPIIGALYFGALTIAGVGPLVVFLATGGGVVVLLLILPGGIGQLVFDLRDAALRRFARAHHIPVPSLIAEDRDADARAPMAPPVGDGAGFVASRYRIGDQWALEEVRR